jgi:hypothetical protein
MLALVFVAASCGTDKNSGALSTIPPTSASTSNSVSSSAPISSTGASTKPVDIAHACTVLHPSDFATVGYTVAREGDDVSQNFVLDTTTSVACQWSNDDNNHSDSWELAIGTGGAKAAYASDLQFAQFDTVTKLTMGDESFIADEVRASDKSDHDYSVSVRTGDTYFTMSTTSDTGADAVKSLAKLVLGRLTKS